MPSRGTTAARAAALMVMGALLLTGCTGGGPTETPPPIPPYTPPAASRPTPTPTPSEAPAPETVPPERPAAVDEQSVEGAEATARYFLALYPYTYATGDLTEWQRLSHPDCNFCASVADEVRAETAQGRVSRGGLITVIELTTEAIDDGFVAITGRVAQQAATVTDADGKVVKESKAEDLSVAIAVEQTGGSWAFRALEVLDEEPS